MEINKHPVFDDILIITLDSYPDNRGLFRETFNSKINELIDVSFCQDNESISSYGVFRGMHLQLGEFAQSKLIRVVQGSIFDMFTEINPNSPNFGRTEGYTLEPGELLFLPNHYAHGFDSLENNTIVNYKVDKPWNKESEVTIKYDTLPFITDAERENWRYYKIVSERDRNAISWDEFINKLNN